MVTVYSKPACVQCNATYRKIEELGLKYTVIDVSVHEDALQHIKELGYLQAPVVIPSFDKIITDSKGERIVHWSGYRPDLLEQLKTL